MNKFYKEPYFDNIAWLFENLDRLKLESDVILFLLFIMYCTNKHIPYGYQQIQQKLNKNSNEVDLMLKDLKLKGLIDFKPSSTGLNISLDHLYEFQYKNMEINNDIIDVFEEVFKKPLTTLQLQKVIDLTKKYSENDIRKALRIAETNDILKLEYVIKILKNNEQQS